MLHHSRIIARSSEQPQTSNRVTVSKRNICRVIAQKIQGNAFDVKIQQSEVRSAGAICACGYYIGRQTKELTECRRATNEITERVMIEFHPRHHNLHQPQGHKQQQRILIVFRKNNNSPPSPASSRIDSRPRPGVFSLSLCSPPLSNIY